MARKNDQLNFSIFIFYKKLLLLIYLFIFLNNKILKILIKGIKMVRANGQEPTVERPNANGASQQISITNIDPVTYF